MRFGAPSLPAARITRGLRFRLTFAYALFFSLVSIVAAVLFRQFLSTSLDEQAHYGLGEEWSALKAYLRVDNGKPIWFADVHDPEEAGTKVQLQRVFLLADSNGKIINESPEFHTLGVDSPSQIQAAFKATQTIWIEAQDNKHVPYLVRGGFIADETTDDRYFVAIGTSLGNNRVLLRGFTWLAGGVIPAMILSGCIMGWVLAGRGLTPVREVAKAAQRISGSNLSLRIPTRGANDELDFLIETFNEMIQRLEHSFRQIRQFSTDVSHELRTPITIIRGQLEVALFTATTTEQYRETIIDTLQDIERLSQIVRALLLLSQAETGQVVLQLAGLDLAEVVRDIGDQFQIPAEGARIRLSISTPDSCPAELDRVQIERMLSNLLSNAIKFTPEGGEVRAILSCEEANAILIIEDTGRGIDPEHLPNIFDRFYRVGSGEAGSTPEKGLGLGLSFVAWIVKAHQGTIDVESQPGKGTRFTVHLPRHAAPVPVPMVNEPEAMKKV